MKTLLLMFALVQSVPERINFQGRLTNATGTPINAATTLTFRLYAASTGGAPIWTEVQPAVPVVNGIYSVYLGDVTSLSGIAFDVAYWVSVEAGTDGEMTPRYRLSSSPYALRSRVANSLEGLTATAAQLNTLVGGGNADTLHVHDWAAITGKPPLAIVNQTNTFPASQAFTVPTGTSPFTVSSTTLVTNLNADRLDGMDASAFAPATHDHAGSTWTTPAAIGLSVTSTAPVPGGVGLLGAITGPGATSGVRGESASSSGFGVQGLNNFGGTGVFGNAAAGSAVGVRGVSSAATGYGVHGSASSGSGVNYGVYGTTSSPAGFGLYTPNNAFVGGNLTVGGSITGAVTIADGSITAAKLASFPKVRAEMTVPVSCNGISNNLLPFGAEAYDTDNMHDNAVNNSRLTVNTPGVYRITVTVPVSTTNDGGFRLIQIRKNGTTLIGGHSNAVPINISSMFADLTNATVTAQFAAGDYVEAIFNHRNNNDNPVNVGGAHFTMEYVP